jgi:hypothetical protein
MEVVEVMITTLEEEQPEKVNLLKATLNCMFTWLFFLKAFKSTFFGCPFGVHFSSC